MVILGWVVMSAVHQVDYFEGANCLMKSIKYIYSILSLHNLEPLGRILQVARAFNPAYLLDFDMAGDNIGVSK